MKFRVVTGVLGVLAVASVAMADTPPSAWDRAKDPSIGKTYDVHVTAQGYIAAASQAQAIARKGQRFLPDAIVSDAGKSSYEAARLLLEKANAADSPDVRLRFDYGLVLQKLHDNVKAFEVLSSALAMAPNHPLAIDGGFAAWNTYAYVSNALEKPDEEIRGWENYLQHATEATDRLIPTLNLAEAEMTQGNLAESARGYQSVLTLAASLPNEISMESAVLATWGLAVALDRAGDTGASMRAADSAASMDPPPESSRDPYFAKSALPGSYSINPAIAVRRAIILDESNVFFVPAYERKWYLALGEAALARRAADPNIQLFHWRAVEKFWTDYVDAAHKHKRAQDRYVGTAEKRLEAAVKKRQELEKRLGGKMKLPRPQHEIFLD